MQNYRKTLLPQLLWASAFVGIFSLLTSCGMPQDSGKGLLSISLPGAFFEEARAIRLPTEVIDGMIYRLELSSPGGTAITLYARSGESIAVELEPGHWAIDVAAFYLRPDSFVWFIESNTPLEMWFDDATPAGTGSVAVEIKVGRQNKVEIPMSVLEKFVTPIIPDNSDWFWTGQFVGPQARSLQAYHEAEFEIPKESELLTVKYQWFSNTFGSNEGGTILPSEINENLTPNPASTVMFYYCKITYEFQSSTGDEATESLTGLTAPIMVVPQNSYGLQYIIDNIEIDRIYLAGGEFPMIDPVTVNGKDIHLDVVNSDTTLMRQHNGDLLRVYSGSLILSGTTGFSLVLDGDKDAFTTGTGPLVHIVDANVVMNDGVTLQNNHNIENGGGVVLIKGTFTINGGEISGNKSDSNGGGMYVSPQGHLFMPVNSTGSIINNTAGSSGGGVYIEGGEFRMNDGQISDNEAGSEGGGVYISAEESRRSRNEVIIAGFYMQGGEISGNTAGSGGGGVVVSGSNFTLEGGSISSNTAGSGGGGGVLITGSTSDSGVFMKHKNSIITGTGSFSHGGTTFGANTANNGNGHAVFDNTSIPPRQRNSTVGPDDEMSNDSSSSDWDAYALTGTVIISGTPVVDEELEADVSDFFTDELQFQWRRNLNEINNATDQKYTIVPDDHGTSISVRVTSKNDNFTGFVTSEPVLVKTRLSGTVIISGTPQVGQTLTANTSGLNASGSFEFQWRRGDEDIPNAIGQSYTLVPDDHGTNISVRVTSANVNYTGSVTSTSVLVANGTLTGQVKITWDGDTDAPQVGDTLRVEVLNSNAGEPFKFQWLRGIIPIPGATTSTYVLVADDDEATITVQVTRDWYTGMISDSVTVASLITIITSWTDLRDAIQTGSGTEIFTLVPGSNWNATATISIDRPITLLAEGAVTILRASSFTGEDTYLFKVTEGGILTLGESDMVGTLTLSGNNIPGNNGSLIRVEGFYDGNYVDEVTAELVMYAGVTITANITSDSGGGVHVAPGGAFTMEGGTISNNETTTDFGHGGGGVYSIGPFIMKDGLISGNKANTNGSGVSIQGWGWPFAAGTFTMSGGEISGNTGADYGGGVYVEGSTSASYFTMSGSAKISGNQANLNGGGVYTNLTFTMVNGEISDNTASGSGVYGRGGGVYVAQAGTEGGEFVMEGGIIIDNKAERGAGVSTGLGSTGSRPAIIMSGSARVDQNNEVFLDGNGGTINRVITIDGILTSSPVALIRPAHYQQTNGSPRRVLTDDFALDNNYGKFLVVPQASPQQNWTVNSEGFLVHAP